VTKGDVYHKLSTETMLQCGNNQLIVANPLRKRGAVPENGPRDLGYEIANDKLDQNWITKWDDDSEIYILEHPHDQPQ
jgi:hypothetical protein